MILLITLTVLYPLALCWYAVYLYRHAEVVKARGKLKNGVVIIQIK